MLKREGAAFLGVALGTLALRTLFSASLEITSVESYLWLSAQRPALGYFDYPGMCAWLIAGVSALIGDALPVLRLPFVLCGVGAAWFMRLTAERLYGPGPGFLALFFGLFAPLFAVYGTLATPDAPLLLFWSAAVWAMIHALKGSAAHWLAAGVFLGLAMDSKYHAAFLGLGLLGVCLLPEHRHWLRRKEPWLAALLALAVFSPTVVWNARHGWESFLYQGVQRFGERSFRAGDLVQWPAAQLLWLTPLLGLLAWGAGFRTLLRWRTAPAEDRFLAVLGMPLLLFFCAILFVRPVRGHWAAPAYVTLVPLALGVMSRVSPAWRRGMTGTVVLLAALALLLPPLLVLTPGSWREGWSQLAVQVRQRRSPDFVIARDYHVASQMAYQLRKPGTPAFDFTPLGRSSKGFRRWWDADAFRGKSAVIVYDAPGPRQGEEAMARAAFRWLGPLEEVRVRRFWGREESFFLQQASDYLGLSDSR